MQKLAIVTTHPIQYNAPLFQLLTKRENIQIKVFYTWGKKVLDKKYDPGFGKNIEWDLPLLEGYDHEFLENDAKDPGSHHHNGISNPNIIERIQAFAPTSLLIYGWNFKSHLRVMRFFHKKIGVLFRGDSTLLDEKGRIKTIIRHIFLKWIYSHVDKALYAGRNNRAYFLKHGLHATQLVFVPHAIDNNRFAQDDLAQNASAAAWKDTLGIDEQEMIFLFAGKLHDKKNPTLLLEAFLDLKTEGASLIIVGNGELENSLKETAAGHQNVYFIDFQNQTKMPAVYRMADVFVLPSKGPGETWGLAVNEAMACGRVIIVSDKTGCYPDLVENSINGYVFESGNRSDLTKKLQQCMQARDILKTMGAASFNKIKSWSLLQQAIAIEKLHET